MQITTAAGRDGLAAIRSDPGRTLAGFDYDGTLAPIVEDPGDAVVHPEVLVALARLAERIGLVAIVTGRPADQAVELGGLSRAEGLNGLVVVGQYGLQRWEAATDEVVSADPPPGLATAWAELPGLLSELGLGDAYTEDKGLAVAVHVRRLPDPQRATEVLREPLRSLAERTGLRTEPGRMVVELRPPGMDKGQALRRLIEETAATAVMFCGDDLGDLPAFEEVERWRGEGGRGLLVCSGSDEVSEVAERADVVVDGPAGVAALVDELASAIGT